jgi:hypothetical protein
MSRLDQVLVGFGLTLLGAWLAWASNSMFVDTRLISALVQRVDDFERAQQQTIGEIRSSLGAIEQQHRDCRPVSLLRRGEE